MADASGLLFTGHAASSISRLSVTYLPHLRSALMPFLDLDDFSLRFFPSPLTFCSTPHLPVASSLPSQIKKAYCPPEVVEGNPVLDYCKHLLFAWSGEVTFELMLLPSSSSLVCFSSCWRSDVTALPLHHNLLEVKVWRMFVARVTGFKSARSVRFLGHPRLQQHESGDNPPPNQSLNPLIDAAPVRASGLPSLSLSVSLSLSPFVFVYGRHLCCVTADHLVPGRGPGHVQKLRRHGEGLREREGGWRRRRARASP